jgi:hypothetical protein
MADKTEAPPEAAPSPELFQAMRQLSSGELRMEEADQQIVEGLERLTKWSRDELERFFEGRRKREAGSPKPGMEAPAFTLELLSPEGHRTGETRHLRDHRGRPVALIFGSYTWPPFRAQAGRLNEIYRTYREQVDFYCVYIREAHPEDGWQVPSNVKQGVVFQQPTTADERAAVAEACLLRLNLEMPMLLDDMDDVADRAYVALPDRLYVVDAAGSVALQSGPGPWGFDVDSWEKAIRSLAATGRAK